jgi:hypothetical protein
MDIPAIYYVNVIFAWTLVLMSVAGYVNLSKKTGERRAFWLVFAAAWVMFGISHTLLVAGAPSGAWYLMLLRVLGYVLNAASLLVLMAGEKTK